MKDNWVHTTSKVENIDVTNGTSGIRNTANNVSKRVRNLPKLDHSGIQDALDEMDKIFNSKFLEDVEVVQTL